MLRVLNIILVVLMYLVSTPVDVAIEFLWQKLSKTGFCDMVHFSTTIQFFPEL